MSKQYVGGYLYKKEESSVIIKWLVEGNLTLIEYKQYIKPTCVFSEYEISTLFSTKTIDMYDFLKYVKHKKLTIKFLERILKYSTKKIGTDILNLTKSEITNISLLFPLKYLNEYESIVDMEKVSERKELTESIIENNKLSWNYSKLLFCENKISYIYLEKQKQFIIDFLGTDKIILADMYLDKKLNYKRLPLLFIENMDIFCYGGYIDLTKYKIFENIYRKKLKELNYLETISLQMLSGLTENDVKKVEYFAKTHMDDDCIEEKVKIKKTTGIKSLAELFLEADSQEYKEYKITVPVFLTKKEKIELQKYAEKLLIKKGKI